MNSRPTERTVATADHAAVRADSDRASQAVTHPPLLTRRYTVTDSEGDAKTNTRDTGDCPQTVMKFFFQCVYLSVFTRLCAHVCLHVHVCVCVCVCASM